MRTTVSIPDDVFKKAEVVAARLNMKRSHLYALAVSAFVSRNEDATIRERLDEVYGREDAALGVELMAMQLVSLPGES